MENRYYNSGREYVQARSREYTQPQEQGNMRPQSSGSGGGSGSSPVPVSVLVSVVSALLSLICLITVSGVKGDIKDAVNQINASFSQLQQSYTALDNRLGEMDNTLANTQNNAYNQLASQSITITKNLTSLTGPVKAGTYNQMFIVKAKGALDLNTSFTWQKYNETTGGWVPIVFTGTATSNDEYGLRLENRYDNEEGSYVTVLWANGINMNAVGSYRCVITDSNGITKNSDEAIVQVSEESE